MQKPWLKSYPSDVPAEVGGAHYRSLVDLLEEAFKKYAAQPAATCMGKTISYRDVDEMSSSFGAWLQAQGLKRGARVAVMMPNVLQYTVAIPAVLRAGFVVVNVNPLYTPRELEHQLNDSGAEAIVVLENFATTLQQVIENTPVKHVVLASMGDLLGGKGALVNFVVRHLKKMVPAFELPLTNGRTVTRFNAALAQGSRMSLKRPEIGADDVAFLQYTGGTTGVSKGATLLNRNVLANVLQTEAWFGPRLTPKDGGQKITVCALPLYHIFALTCCFLLGCRVGAMNLLIPNPRDIPGFVKELGKYKVTMFPAVNTLFNGLTLNPDFAKLDFSRLTISNGGGTAVQQATAERWHQITGCKVVEGYGLSETSPVVTINRVEDGFTGTIGLPIPSTEISIRDDDENEVAVGEAGEICIRGPQVMAGYWNRDDETAKVMTKDGFFKSGDVGVMNDGGFVKIVDRKKDMILVSGFNVYPNEIEQVVNLLPGVAECAAVGVNDAKTGEAVKLFIVKSNPSLTEEAVVAHCQKNLTAYKRPKLIEFRAELPKTNVGKILRRALREPA